MLAFYSISRGYKEVDGMEDNKCVNYLPELNKELAVVHFVIVIQCVMKICYCYPLWGIRCIVYVRYGVVEHSVTRHDKEISIHAVEM